MLGCYDALQKKYLRMIVLAVYTHPEDPQTITECYHFKFKYTHHGPLLDFSRYFHLDFFLLYGFTVPLINQPFTPPDYQPPGFKEGECEGMIFEGEPMYLNVGEVPTPFHMLKVKVTTEKQRMENADKSILKQGDTNVPLQVLKLDKDDTEEQNRHMNEDPVLDNKVEDRKKVNISEVEEPNLTCEEDEITKAEENRNPYVANPQVDHLAHKTSELHMSESRTRSGKIFQTSAVHQFELFSSQDVLPKRRKISEPKEQF
nr:PREDICTED: HORMA domain-containing protein 1 [Apteryx mantelli mantelli]